MLDVSLSRRSFLGWFAAVLVAAKRKPRKPPPTTAAPTFRLRSSRLRGGDKLRGGL